MVLFEADKHKKTPEYVFNNLLFFSKSRTLGLTLLTGVFLFSCAFVFATSTETTGGEYVLLGDPPAAEATCGTDLMDYYNTGDDDWLEPRALIWRGQTFTATSTYEIGCVRLRLFRTGLPGTLDVKIYPVDASSSPTSTALAYGTTDADIFTESTDGDWYEITFTEREVLENGIQYALVIYAAGGDESNKIGWRVDTISPTYAGGNVVISNDGGSTWSQDVDKDFMFETWSVLATSSASTTEADTEINDVSVYPAIFFYAIIVFVIGFYVVVKL